MTKPRKLHPIVQVTQDAATELNDLLNAIGLRIALLRHQPESSSAEAEMARLAGLVEKACERVQRLQEYTRAEQLVASMRPAPVRKRSGRLSASNLPSSALLIAEESAENSWIKEDLERSGCTVVVADSAANALKLMESGADFDHIVCDSAILAESGWNFTAELSQAAPASRIYVFHPRRTSDQVTDRHE